MRFAQLLEQKQKWRDLLPARPPDEVHSALSAAVQAILAGGQKYTDITAPILSIYALPHDTGLGFKDPKVRAAAEALDFESTSAQALAFEIVVPSALAPRAHRNICEVLKNAEAFISQIPSEFVGVIFAVHRPDHSRLASYQRRSGKSLPHS